MSNALTRLESELERTLGAIKFFREFNGALNYEALKVLFEATRTNEGERVLKVAVRDVTGHFFRGRITAIREGGGSFEVRADDDDLVPGVTAEQIIAARIQDRM